jgi:hypothetical protein
LDQKEMHPLESRTKKKKLYNNLVIQALNYSQEQKQAVFSLLNMGKAINILDKGERHKQVFRIWFAHTNLTGFFMHALSLNLLIIIK